MLESVLKLYLILTILNLEDENLVRNRFNNKNRPNHNIISFQNQRIKDLKLLVTFNEMVKNDDKNSIILKR